jgi:hypothetical protein
MASEPKGNWMENPVTRRAFMAVLAVTLFVLAGERPSYAQTETDRAALRLKLLDQAKLYYFAFERGDFGTMWTFFDPTMQRDNPKEEYANYLGKSIGEVKVVAPPTVIWIEPMPLGDKMVFVGLTQATIRVSDRGGHAITTVDAVDWEFDRNTWSLIGGPMLPPDDKPKK